MTLRSEISSCSTDRYMQYPQSFKLSGYIPALGGNCTENWGQLCSFI